MRRQTHTRSTYMCTIYMRGHLYMHLRIGKQHHYASRQQIQPSRKCCVSGGRQPWAEYCKHKTAANSWRLKANAEYRKFTWPYNGAPRFQNWTAVHRNRWSSLCQQHQPAEDQRRQQLSVFDGQRSHHQFQSKSSVVLYQGASTPSPLPAVQPRKFPSSSRKPIRIAFKATCSPLQSINNQTRFSQWIV